MNWKVMDAVLGQLSRSFGLYRSSISAGACTKRVIKLVASLTLLVSASALSSACLSLITAVHAPSENKLDATASHA